MLEEQYATPRFAKGSAGLRFTDRSGSQQFARRWNGDGYVVVGVVPLVSWDNPLVPEYFVAMGCSVAMGRGEDILATEMELEPAATESQ